MKSTHKPECTKATPVFDCPFDVTYHTPTHRKRTLVEPMRHSKPQPLRVPNSLRDCEPSGLASLQPKRGNQGFHIRFKPNVNRPLRFLEDTDRSMFALNLLSSEEFVDSHLEKAPLLQNSTEVSPETPHDNLITLEESHEIWGETKGEDDFDFSVRFGSDDDCEFIDEESDLELFIEEEPAQADQQFEALEQDLFDIEFDDLELVLEESANVNASPCNDQKNRPVARNLFEELNAAAKEEPVMYNDLNCSIDSELERRISKLNDSEILNLQEIRDRKKVTKSAPKIGDSISKSDSKQLKTKITTGTVGGLVSGLNICVSGVALEGDIAKGTKKQLTRSLDFKGLPQRLSEIS